MNKNTVSLWIKFDKARIDECVQSFSKKTLPASNTLTAVSPPH